MSDANQIPSGEPQGEPVANPGEAEQKNQKDSVKYETYSKVLGEKKKAASDLELARAKIAEFEARDQQAKEEKLKDEEKWQEYAKEQQAKADAAQQELQSYRNREVYQAKVSKVVGLVDGLSSKYHHLIDDDAIGYDPSTGEFDESSLQKEVERIKSQYPEVLVKPQNSSFPGNAPKPNGNASMSAVDFARLSKDEKKARLGEVSSAPDWMRGKF